MDDAPAAAPSSTPMGMPTVSAEVAKIEIVRHGDARRAKLYYLRDRVGKSRRLRDRRRGLKHVKDSGARN